MRSRLAWALETSLPLPEAATTTVIQIFRPDEDEFGGTRSTQLVHQDIRAFSRSSPSSYVQTQRVEARRASA